MSTALATTQRRRIAVCDGVHRHELALSPGTSLATALGGLGVQLIPGQCVLLDGVGNEVDPTAPAEELVDGALFTVIDVRDAVRPLARTASPAKLGRVLSLWWLLAALGIACLAVQFLVPATLDATQRWVVALTLAVGATASGIGWAVRANRSQPLATAASMGPVLLAFGAAIIAVPPLTSGGVHVAVCAGCLAAATLASMLAVIIRSAADRAELGITAAVFIGVALVWGVVLVGGLPASAAAAITMGLIPLVLRVLPSLVLDVPAGMFIDYPRFQIARWSVRERAPRPVESVPATAASTLIETSTAQLTAGTALLSALAALSAPLALSPTPGDDASVSIGRVCLAACLVLSLLLSTRHVSIRALRVMPSLAAAVIVCVVAHAVSRQISTATAAIVAAIFLACAVVAGLLAIPLGRGSRSLVWSRLADLVEWCAVVLALPSALLAAGVFGMVRGMMSG